MTRREVRGLFAQLRAAAELRGFPRARRVRLAFRDRECFGCCARRGSSRCPSRSYAEFDPDTGTVELLTLALGLPRANVEGLLVHELGHALDWWLEAPGAEARADLLGEVATGRRVRYDARLVQTTGRGRAPRPRSLQT